VALTRDPSSVSLPEISQPENTLVQAVDLASEASIADAFEVAVSKFGRIDVVVNNAGYAIMGELESTNIQKAREQFEVRLDAVPPQTPSPLTRWEGSGLYTNYIYQEFRTRM